MILFCHETIQIHQDGSYHVADNQKGKSTAMGLQVWKTREYHRKNMKRKFDWDVYHQRSKVEAIFSVIKRMFGSVVMSRGIVTQNREMIFRMIAYNCYRITGRLCTNFGWFLQSHCFYYLLNLEKVNHDSP